jgi:large subunit ribosomal protein L17
MLRNLVTSLLEHEHVRTTDAKAKEVRRLAERMITLGKRGTLHARRQALETIRSKEVAAKLFDVLADRYDARHGGYTRIVKLGRRTGDNAPMSIIQLIPEDEEIGSAPDSASESGSKAGAGAGAS